MEDTYLHKGKRRILVEYLRERVGIGDERVLSAINSVPRHFFLESIFEDFAYEDRAFTIASGQTISHPSTVAEQTELLQVEKGEKVLEIGADLNLKWFDTKLFANYFRIGQLAYFDSSAMPQQSTSSVNISQVGGEATFTYRKFNFNAKVLVQNVLSNKDLLPLPEFIGRANVYYQSKIFKKAAEIQTGIKAYYFSTNNFIIHINWHSNQYLFSV